MKTKTSFLPLGILLGLISLLIVREATSAGGAFCTIDSCTRRITIKFKGGEASQAELSTDMSELHDVEGGDRTTRYYRAGIGQELNVKLQPPNNCGTLTASLSTCSSIIYSKRRTSSGEWQSLWQKGAGLSTSNGNGCSAPGDPGPGGGDEPACGCENCTQEAGCMCCCYKPGAPGGFEEKYTKYYKANTETASPSPMGDESFEEAEGRLINEKAAENPPKLLVGYPSPGVLLFKDTDTDKASAQSIPDENSSQQEQDDYTNLNLGPAPPPEMVQLPGTPDAVCECRKEVPGSGGSSGSSNPPAPQSDEILILVWDPPESSRNDRGAGFSFGPALVVGGGMEGGDAPGVPLNIDFGLGRDSAGQNPASLSFSTSLDAVDPLKLDNFTLTQPFASPGAGPVQIITPPPTGVSRRLEGIGARLDMIKSADNNTLELRFSSLSAPETIEATHVLQRITGTIGTVSVPGISYTVTRNNVTQTILRYGMSDGAGRIWQEVVLAAGSTTSGDVTEGSSVITVSPAARTETMAHKKRVNNVDTLLDQTIESYATYSFGERLLSRSVQSGMEAARVTTYAYHESGPPAVLGKLKWQTEPDGNWRRCEYNPATGRLLRELRPWLSTISNPAHATYENSAATTYLEINASERWEIESIEGKVISRRWQRDKTGFFNQLTRATNYAWHTPIWQIELPTDFRTGDVADSARSLGVALLALPDVVLDFSFFGGSISQALTGLLGAEVVYDQVHDRWETRSKDVLDAFAIVEQEEVAATGAELKFTSWPSSTNLEPVPDEKILVILGDPATSTQMLEFTVPDRTSSNEPRADYKARVYGEFVDYLQMNVGAAFTVAEAGGIVTLGTTSTGAAQTLGLFKAVENTVNGQTVVTYEPVTPESFGTPGGRQDTGTDAFLAWAPVTTKTFQRQVQQWVLDIPPSTDPAVPSYNKDTFTPQEKASFAVAANGSFNSKGPVSTTFSARLTQLVQAGSQQVPLPVVSYQGSGRWGVSSGAIPPAVTIYRLITPQQEPDSAKLSLDCTSLAPGDVVRFVTPISATENLDVSITVQGDENTTAAEIASALKGSFLDGLDEETYPLVFTIATDGSTLEARTRETGADKELSMMITDGETFFETIDEDTGTDRVLAFWGLGMNVSWRLAGTDVGSVPPTLADLQLFEGRFGSSMSQTFTADYAHWNGSLTLTDDTTGMIKSSIGSNGQVTYYDYVKGTHDGANFTWNGSGEALKKTTRRFAVNPATFQLLAADPVTNVSMADYQGLTRVQQTWKDEDKVMESTHSYDASTRERRWTKEGTVKTYDAVRNPTNNTLTVTDADGTQTRTSFDSAGEVINSAKLGYGGTENIVTSTVEDGLTTMIVTAAGTLRRISSSTRDAQGRLVSATDDNGSPTGYAYEDEGRRVIETRPDGGTVVTQYHLDGRLKSVTGTGVVPEYHTYSVDVDGNLMETTYHNDDGGAHVRSPRWTSTTTNGLGWIIAEARPAPPPAIGGTRGTLVTRHYYNSKGQRIRTEQPGQPDMLLAYDLFGRQSAQGIDMNGNGIMDVAGAGRDPVNLTQTTLEKVGTSWFEKSVTTEAVGAGTEPKVITSYSLLGGALFDCRIQYTSDGLVTTTTTSRAPTTRTVTTVTTTNRTASGQTSTRKAVNGLLVEETVPGATGKVYYRYDDLERPEVVTSLDGVERKTVYDDESDSEGIIARSRVWKEQMQNVQDNNFVTQRTYGYHDTPGQPGFGRVSTITNADSTTQTLVYDRLGRQTFQGGTAAYPVRYEYDYFGELWKMHTHRDGSPTASSNGDVTTWNRDDATGVLLSKTDATEKGATITYDTATGRVWKRTLARKDGNGADITITYGYDDAGRLRTTTYSDGTPKVSHTYNADGQLDTTEDAAGLHTYAYDGPAGQLSREEVSEAGLLSGSSWSSTFVMATGVNGHNQRDVLTWSWGAFTRDIDHDYDDAGRLKKVTAFGQHATYGYDAITGQKETLTYSGAGLTGTWHHDTKSRLEWIRWDVGSTVVSRHDYGFDDVHRRTSAERETGETWRYGYNDRGEVDSAVKYTGSSPSAEAKRGLQFGYGYDLIGNRTMSAQHTPQSENAGSSLEQVTWVPNNLNQVATRGHHSSQWVFGHVKAAATLDVQGGGSVVRSGDEFVVPVTRTGAATTADWHELDVTASLTGVGRVNASTGQPMDVTTRREGHVWFSSSPESFAYDDDGNLMQDGRWNYRWDAENRLTIMETRQEVASANAMVRLRLEFAYDWKSRRIRKVVKEYQQGTGTAPSLWKTKSDLRFLYDGWNLLAEIEMVPSTGFSDETQPSLLRSYAWGVDISGSSQRAGGVGGLLLVQGNDIVLAPCYDGNGNISAYVKVVGGKVTSRHDYDAFGRQVWNELEGAGGYQTSASPFGFSTKYQDLETGLVYYGYRYYSAALGRWMSRDPSEEKGGINLFAICRNAPLNCWDYLGLFLGFFEEIDTMVSWAPEPCPEAKETKFIQVVENRVVRGAALPFRPYPVPLIRFSTPALDDGTIGAAEFSEIQKERPFYPSDKKPGTVVDQPIFYDEATYDQAEKTTYHVCRVCVCRHPMGISLFLVGPCKTWKAKRHSQELETLPDIEPPAVWKKTLNQFIWSRGGVQYGVGLGPAQWMHQWRN